MIKHTQVLRKRTLPTFILAIGLQQFQSVEVLQATENGFNSS